MVTVAAVAGQSGQGSAHCVMRRSPEGAFSVVQRYKPPDLTMVSSASFFTAASDLLVSAESRADSPNECSVYQLTNSGLSLYTSLVHHKQLVSDVEPIGPQQFVSASLDGTHHIIFEFMVCQNKFNEHESNVHFRNKIQVRWPYGTSERKSEPAMLSNRSSQKASSDQLKNKW